MSEIGLEDYLRKLAPIRKTPTPEPLNCKDNPPPSELSRYDDSEIDSLTTLQRGRLFEPISYLEPEEEIIKQFLFRVPSNEIRVEDKLHFKVNIWVAKGKRMALQIEEPKYQRTEPGPTPPKACPTSLKEYLVTEFSIRPLSQIGKLVGGRQAVDIMESLSWSDDVDWDPWMSVCINPAGYLDRKMRENPPKKEGENPKLHPSGLCSNPEGEYNRKAREYYGLAATGSTAYLVPTETPQYDVITPPDPWG